MNGNKDKNNKPNNKPVILRVLVLIICVALFIGAAIIPFFSAMK